MEQRISLIVWKLDAYRTMTNYFDASPDEKLSVGFGKSQKDPFRPTWVRSEISEVLIPDENDYLVRTPTYIHMKRSFHANIERFTEKHGLQPLVFDHKQPIDLPSGIDRITSSKVAQYYSNAVMGSYNNRVHRFFRFAGDDRMQIIPWFIDDETYKRQELAFGKEAQYRVASVRLLLVGAGGIGWKAGTDLALKGHAWIDIVDPDVIEQSNLARLPLPPSSVGASKATELVKILNQMRPNGIFQAWTCTIEDFPESELANHDLIIVATDNVPSRLYCNDVSLTYRIPSIQIGASLENNQEAISRRVIIPGFTPCYECHKKFTPEQLRFNYTSPKQEEWLKRQSYGLPQPVPSVVDLNSIASGLVSDAAFKILTRNGNVPSFIFFNITTGNFESHREKRDPACRACSGISDFDAEWLSSTIEESAKKNRKKDRVQH